MWNFIPNPNIFIQEYAFEKGIRKMVVILSQPRGFNPRKRQAFNGKR